MAKKPVRRSERSAHMIEEQKNIEQIIRMNQAENNQLPMDQLARIRAMSGDNAGLAEMYGHAGPR